MIQQLTERAIAVTLPTNATDPWVINNGREKVGLNWYEPDKTFGDEKFTYSSGVPLPPGSWRFLCTSKECSEEQAAKVVDFSGTHYKDYTTLISNYISAQYSLKSLLRSKSLDPVNNNYALLIKED